MSPGASDNGLDIREIMLILPHRYPMLLIDRITELDPMRFARGYKNITANEPMFTGHFPENPVLPGVYMIEALAQLGGATVMQRGEMARKVPLLVGVDKVRFRRPIRPGDRMDMQTTVTRSRQNIGWCEAEASVDGKLACSGELMFSIADAPGFGYDATILHL